MAASGDAEAMRATSALVVADPVGQMDPRSMVSYSRPPPGTLAPIQRHTTSSIAAYKTARPREGPTHSMRVLKAMDRDAVDYSKLTVAQLEELVPQRAARRRERDALLMFAQATGDGTWYEKCGWRVDGRDLMITGLGKWQGISTGTMEDERVIQIDLPNNNLRGFISPQLEHLHKLRVVCLRNNQLVGPIPEAIAPGKVLVELDLSSNRLSGPLPRSIFESRFLEKLNLSKNNLTGAIPPTIGQLASLKELYLDFNQLSGAWPLELLSILQQLKAYRFRANAFTLPPITEADEYVLASISSLAVADCALSGEIPSRLLSHGSLHCDPFGLQMNDGLCLPLDASPLQPLISLHHLALHDLVGPLPPSWGSLSNLVTLRLGVNQLTGPIPSSFGDMAALQHLDLSCNQLGGDVPLSLSRLVHLRELRLSRNPHMLGVLPDGLSRLVRLHVLALDGCKGLYGSVPDSYSALSRLTELTLGDNKFSGPLPRCVEHMCSLQTLDLSCNGFIKPLPQSLTTLTRLEYLYLHENRFTGKFHNCYSALTTLKDLSVYGNQLEGPFPITYDVFREHMLHLPPLDRAGGGRGEEEAEMEDMPECMIARNVRLTYVPKKEGHRKRARLCVIS